jgi:hypothetical protein
MNRWKLGKIVFGLALACAIAGSGAAQERDLGLEQYVGKIPDRQFYNLPAVHDPLLAVMDGHLDAFLKRFQVVQPIGKVGRDLVAEGCVRNECADEQAAFAIDLDSGRLAAANLRQGRYLDIYSKTTTAYADLPPGLRHWISNRTPKSGELRQLKLRFFN